MKFNFASLGSAETFLLGNLLGFLILGVYYLFGRCWGTICIGTKSVLFGAHCFFIHPWFVALAWWKLYGFPFDPRLWVAFFVHDLGYIGKPNMDGEEGELHPILGARIMYRLFDRKPGKTTGVLDSRHFRWHDFSLAHSRYLAKRIAVKPSRLCFADKLSFALTPAWLYLPMVRATGELNEYLKNAQRAETEHWKPTNYDAKLWHKQLCEYMVKWVEAHKGGAEDTWTSKRHGVASGVR